MIEEHGSRFKVGLNLVEDQLFMFQVLPEVQRVRRIGDVMYGYRENRDSLMKTWSVEDFVGEMKLYGEVMRKSDLWRKHGMRRTLSHYFEVMQSDCYPKEKCRALYEQCFEAYVEPAYEIMVREYGVRYGVMVRSFMRMSRYSFLCGYWLFRYVLRAVTRGMSGKKRGE